MISDLPKWKQLSNILTVKQLREELMQYPPEARIILQDNFWKAETGIYAINYKEVQIECPHCNQPLTDKQCIFYMDVCPDDGSDGG